MTISPQAKSLPAYKIASTLNEVLAINAITVLTAPPGAGKSTLLPLTILSALKSEGNIFVVEPRRIAARQVAERLAENIGEPCGKTVGYTVRFEKKTSKDTRIEVVTEGVMMRRLLTDSMLEDISIVIFDEFHERSLDSDVALALTREIQQLLRPELKILLMSATIDTTTICKSLNAPLIECEGRMYDVETIRVPRERDTTDTESIARDVCNVIRKVTTQPPSGDSLIPQKIQEGDILVFLPGQGEIRRCMELLGDSLEGIDVYPLYGLLSPEQQRKAIAPSRQGERKIVLATSIAETSLTIEGVRIVIDSGFCRKVVYDQNTGLSHLETVRISQDMATQRRGRAGRVAEGVCYQLWNNAIDLNMKPNREPEIMDADLSSAILTVMTSVGEPVESIPWLTPPPHANVVKALRLLSELNAITMQDDSFHIIKAAKSLAHLPCHPRIANMLLKSKDFNAQALAVDVAAIIEEKDPLAQTENDADINTRIALLRQARRNNRIGRWSRVEKVAEQYCQMLQCKEDNEAPDPYDTGCLLAFAYPERVGKLQGNGHYRLSGGDNAVVDISDHLSSYDWIVVASMNSQSGKAFLASPVNPEDLTLQEYDNVTWNSKDGSVIAQKEWRIGRLVVESKPLQNIPRETIHGLLVQTAQKEGLSMFDFNDKVNMLQRRIDAVRMWHPELNIPDVSTHSIIARAEEWIPMYCGNVKTSTELKKVDMCEVIWSLLDYDMQQKVDHLAPSHIQMPNGHRIRLDYRQSAVDSTGSPTYMPVLSVRLQECFGMMDSPRVNGGCQPVLMELLSPGFKPVQLTQDLKSFWKTTYFDVRKELRRRYPKHAWPENPCP